MRRLLLGLSALALLASAAPRALACINDREVNRAEREFKSQYQPTAAPTPPAVSPGSRDSVLPIAFLAGGAVLLLAATATVLTPRKR
jgi:hypothetical protein